MSQPTIEMTEGVQVKPAPSDMDYNLVEASSRENEEKVAGVAGVARLSRLLNRWTF